MDEVWWFEASGDDQCNFFMEKFIPKESDDFIT